MIPVDKADEIANKVLNMYPTNTHWEHTQDTKPRGGTQILEGEHGENTISRVLGQSTPNLRIIGVIALKCSE